MVFQFGDVYILFYVILNNIDVAFTSFKLIRLKYFNMARVLSSL